MIKKIRIRNFKCYGLRGADFNLGRVNFIYGDNSVGKSSFLQFLEMLVDNIDHQARYSREVFAKHLFRGAEADENPGFVTALIRVVTENTNVPVESVLKFEPVQGVGAYALKRDGDGPLGAAFWDGILPEGGGRDRIKRIPALRVLVGGEGLPKSQQATSSSFEDVAFANLVDMESETDAVDYLNGIFARLGIHYSCVRDEKGCAVPGRIHDDDFNIDVDMCDVGTGIAGLARLAFDLHNWKGGILALEEPETNVNEMQLAALTRVLVEEALKRPRGVLVVECHSKLMVQKLAALVKEGVISSRADDTGLKVMEVVKESSGSIVRPVPIGDDGTIEWPGDFFPAEGRILRGVYGVGI